MQIAPPKLPRWPRLRDDLRLSQGAAHVSGSPTWLIFDPLNFRYYQIELELFDLIQIWNLCDNAESLQRLYFARTGQNLDQALFGRVYDFADRQELFEENLTGWRSYWDRRERARPGWITWLIHNYLFIRIPLVRPDRFLAAMSPFVAPLYSRWTAALISLCGVLGLYLASRQWDAFTRTFMAFFSPGGFALFVLALVFVKSMHELGHAFTAARYRCSVLTMGIAFLVMTPMLYTDVTDSWKLQSRQRMAIDAAGIIVELAIACLATLFWSFAADGPWRSAMFLLATTSWLSSLVINLSPFMRFDGYYLASDALGVPNLQPRAFRLGTWALREMLFGLGEPAPDQLPLHRRRLVTAYAYCVWLYRAVVFFGIALLVYHYFFKLLGIILFFVEVGWFLARPVFNELATWWTMREPILAARRTPWSLGALALVLALLLLPLPRSVQVPALLEPGHFARVYPETNGDVEAVKVVAGERVKVGQTLFTLSSQKLQLALAQARARLALADARLARRAGSATDLANSLPLEAQRALLQKTLAGLALQQQKLDIKAPISGRIAYLWRGLRRGTTIAADQQAALIIAAAPPHIKGYVHAADLQRLSATGRGEFVPESLTGRSFAVQLRKIDIASRGRLTAPYQASIFNGQIAVRPDTTNDLIPDDALYEARFTGQGMMDVPYFQRGTILAKGRPSSLALYAWRRAAAILVRESGF
ncbi:MAG: biotin/lipoyl-binding protein [Hyphomicrobiales bacterium]|nr:biotin/lipoyl-binding protein [Hyphomicrobiales bacterium]